MIRQRKATSKGLKLNTWQFQLKGGFKTTCWLQRVKLPIPAKGGFSRNLWKPPGYATDHIDYNSHQYWQNFKLWVASSFNMPNIIRLGMCCAKVTTYNSVCAQLSSQSCISFLPNTVHVFSSFLKLDQPLPTQYVSRFLGTKPSVLIFWKMTYMKR